MGMIRPEGEHIKSEQIEFLDVKEQDERIINLQDPLIDRIFKAVQYFSKRNLVCNSSLVMKQANMGKTATKAHLKTLNRDGLLAMRYAKVRLRKGQTTIMPLYVVMEKADLLKDKKHKKDN